MIKVVRLSVIAVISVFLTSCETTDTLQDILNTNLTNEEIVDGLKEALAVGTDTSTAQLSKEDGYYKDLAVKVLLPSEIQTSINTFKSKSVTVAGLTLTGDQLYNGYTNNLLGINIPGLKSKEDELVKGINRAAEAAASTAGPIFIDAITDITIEDGYNILFGGDNTAATSYLRGKTETNLFTKYEPMIDASLKSVMIGNTSVVDEYESFVQSYNDVLNTSILGNSIGSLFNVNPVAQSDLSAYSTQRGLDGLFLKISEEEDAIRNDPLARINDLLKKVFGQLDI